MTNPGPDDRESLVGADVDRAWRALSRDEPPEALDASILAAAHREAGAGPQSVRAKEALAARRRWWPLAAAATVAAIAVGVLQLTPPEHLGAPSAEQATVSDMPAPSEKKNETTAAAPAPSSARSDSPSAPRVEAVPPVNAPAPSLARSDPPPSVRADAAPSSGGSDNRMTTEASRVAAAPRQAPAFAAREPTRQEAEMRPAPPASPAPEPFPGAPKRVDTGASVAAEAQVAPMARKEAPAPAAAPPAATGSVAAERAAQAPAAAAVAAAPPASTAEPAFRAPAAPLAKMSASRADDAAGAARAKDRAPLPVPDWIALIRRLRDEGKTAEAAKELAAFRVAHVDHEKLLPPDLREWHKK